VSFGAPDLLYWALVAPAAALAALLLLRRRSRAESAWVGRALAGRLRSGGRPRSRAAVASCLGLALLGLFLALARPRWGSSTETVERRGLDLVFVLDTSLSMSAADVAPSRFWLAQSLIRRLAAAMPGHRVALVAAEGEGEVLVPLTVDAAVLDLVLDGVTPGSLPLPGTRLADAIERAVGLFPEGGDAHRAILVLSDGEDHGGDFDRALEAVRSSGAKIFTVGVGTTVGAPIPLAGAAGGFKRDRDGEVVVTRLHPETLERLASASGGETFRADSAAFDPAPIARAISGLGGREIESATVSTLEERFQWPLGVGVAALALTLLLAPYRRPAAGAAP